jgi:hypothetical protein
MSSGQWRRTNATVRRLDVSTMNGTRNELAGDQRQLGVEPPEIVWVARHDGRVMAPGEQCDASVDDIRSPSDSAKRTCRASLVQVEIPHVQQSRLQQPSQPHLSRAVSPDLPDHCRWHVDRRAMFCRELDKTTYTPVITFKRDERSSVEYYRPRA